MQRAMQLDLALDAATGMLPASESATLITAKTWEPLLLQWITAIRANRDLPCPGLIRQADEVSLGLRFTDDATITELNSSWRQKPEPTDVLSFAALEDALDWVNGPCVELGDIVVSLETAHRQAHEYNHSLERELNWLVSHGLLHLLGWDHPDEASLRSMLSLQETLLSMVDQENPSNVQDQDETCGDRAGP